MPKEKKSSRDSILSRRIAPAFWIAMIVVMVCTFLPVAVLAVAEPDGVRSVDGLVKHFYEDTKHVFSSPLRWGQSDFVRLTTLSVSAFAIMLADEDLQDRVQRERTQTSDRISRWTDRYSKRVINLSIGALYLSGLVCDDPKLKHTALLCLESVALAEGITKGLKHVVGRSRPYGEKGAFNFDPMRFPPPPYSLSFPSGHATSAFAFSSVVAAQYRSWPVRLISYSFAVTVSLARVNNNAHFLSDVFFGSVVGMAVGRCLVQFHRSDQRDDWYVLPTNHAGRIGAGISVWLR
ncbi:MAG: phosphatase PAP2 family protein [Candidatus Zixiibacteriota bacterium]|nr:MAG: phosphatase PAP2 family protein [candidate division Zixibacteria bacterium]